MKKRNEFLKNVLTVLTGTSISQIIVFSTLPILSRLYSPENFGTLTVYLSTISILGVFSTGKYDKPIMLPKEDSAAVNVLALSISLSIIFCLFLFIIIFLFPNQIINWIKDDTFFPILLYFIPLSILFSGLNISLLTWLNRCKNYKAIAASRVLRAIVTVLVSLALYASIIKSTALIIADIIGWLIACIILGYFLLKHTSIDLSVISVKKMKEMAVRYKKFPIYMIPTDGLNSLSIQMPVYILLNFFGGGIVGFYGFTKRVMDAPVKLLSSSILEVFRQKAAEDYNNYGNCKQIFLFTLKRLVLLTLVPFIIFFFFAPDFFAIIFGEEWRTAGVYSQILATMYLFQFLASPLSYTFIIAEKQREDFLLHIYIGVSTTLSLLLGYYFTKNAEGTLLFFAVSYTIVYIIYIWRSYQHALGDRNKE